MISGEQQHEKYNILLVDDIPSNLNFLSDVLSQEGFGIILSTLGKEAVKTALHELPDLILLDIAMPDLDGYSVCEELKHHPATFDIPVIFLTARNEKEDIIRGFEVGAVDYIMKPFNYTELIARVKTQLELRNKTQQLQSVNQRLEDLVAQRTAELRESNKNLTELNAKLKSAYEELSNLHKVKNEFIRHINHELRTPLQGIHGFTLILEDLIQSPEQKEYLHSINHLVNRLVQLSEISLLFTEIKSENYKIELEEINLNEFVMSLGTQVESRNRNIILDLAETHILIKADQRLLATCVKLILDNAIKFSPDHTRITLKTMHSDNNAMLEVLDQGPGFSKKALKSIFEPFSSDNLQYKTEGFGIGLATAKLILNALSGELKIVNLAGSGACVQMVFPLSCGKTG
ncbi:MAG: hybrid sensor histidine kinase/response regulator [Bacteroidales bacterium]|nr:hybrid sensor histidine kinase/response regulator [Bacteroidales bacterium]MBN2762702.1 hybrid sensor histidine kinase/response regulator [Bacteroidales bacterium]